MFLQKISRDIWESTYKWETDNTPEDTFRRVAKFVSSNEKQYEEQYFNLLKSFKYIPGGRILSNAGTSLKGTTLMNCFVSGFKGTHQDSIESIYDELKRQAKILKSEGGYGFCCDILRPRGTYINGIGVESPGTVEILKLWDISSAVITKGSENKKEQQKGKNKIRKGAMLVSMSCWHPGIEEFITAKQIPGNLTKFNMSVLITDDFIDAVINHKQWNLIFPDTTFKKYNDEWDGNIQKWMDKKYPILIYKTYEDANELWNLIMTSTYNRNEPGVLFIDRINNFNNLKYCEYISATNPCAEEPLPIDGSCCLGSINLTQYVNLKNNSFDFNSLIKDIPLIVRFQDAIIDLTNYPLQSQKDKALKTRRIGIGYMGYASTLYMLKLAYGSKQALEFTEKLCSIVVNALYEASSYLALEKGSFIDFNVEEYLKSEFIKNALNKKTIELIKTNGIRNSHLTTIAPTGTSSIFANNVSGGLEPIFHFSYIRTIVEQNKPNIILPINIDWDHQKYDCNHNKWKWIMEGDEWILRKEVDSTVYKIDRNRGLTKEELVFDYSYIITQENTNNKDYAKTAQDLTIDEHINTMAIFAKYIDASISKTINCKNDISFNEFKDIYLKAYKTNYIKGFTTYRAGTMTSVLSVVSNGNGNSHIIQRDAPKRPKTIPCHIHRITVKGDKWIVFVGLYKGHPYEVFAGKVGLVDIPSKIEAGTLIKQNKGVYSFEYEGEIIIKDVTKIFENENHEALTRLISTSLRHGVPIEFLAQQLSKSKGTIVDFSKSILRSIKKYIPEDAVVLEKCTSCGGELKMNEGCFVCTSCGMSKCG